MKKWVNNLINFTKRFAMPEMIYPGIGLTGKNTSDGYTQRIIPKNHRCTIEIVSVSCSHEGKNTRTARKNS